MPGRRARREGARDLQCPNCGATTAYDVAAGGVACEYCGYIREPEAEVVGRAAEEYEFTLDTLERAGRGWGAERRELHCEPCGADMTLAGGALTTTCPILRSRPNTPT